MTTSTESPLGRRASRPAALLCVLLALFLGACGGSDNSDEASPGNGASDKGTTEVAIEGFNFKPPTITVAVGTTVTWTNQDDFAHTVKPEDDVFAESKNIDKGAPFTHTFDRAGTFPYICGIHNYMSGTVTVE